ncbi:MAG TPA: prepilin peptidase [Candidatus Binataceae bacterium]|nr:prepilin peptidase [Candidatus Binataceae bacterium]
MAITLLGAALAFIFGASIGSFVGVVAYRLPRELSIVKPRSFCPHCKKAIPAWRNIPIVSYLALRGHCADCNAPIGFRYFLAELGLASAAMYFYLHFPLGDALARFGFCAALFVVALIDYDWRVIHNAITFVGMLLGFLAASLLMPEIGWKDSLAGIGVGAGFLFLTGVLYSLVRGAEGVGLGDVFLLGMAGAFLGLWGVIFTLFVGSILGAVGGVAFAIAGGAPPLPDEEIPEAIAEVTGARHADDPIEDVPMLQTAVPFGPFLAMAAAIFALFQPQLTNWYLSR